MNAAIRGKRVFVEGRLVEFWENPEFPFGWTREHLHAYADRGFWVLLFNALVLGTPQPQPDRAS